MHSTRLLGITALLGASIAESLLGPDDVLHRSYESLGVHNDRFLARRDFVGNTTSSEANFLNADGTFNLTEWSTNTDLACKSTLRSLPQRSNPSGTSVCFNLPSLDTATGIFEADLRLYRVFAPSGAWAGVDPKAIDVAVEFPNAQVSAVQDVTKDLRGIGLVGSISKRQAVQEEPSLLQEYFLVGQISEAKMTTNMSLSDLEALVMPLLTLKNGDLQTTLSANGASFLTGVFSNITPLSSFSIAQRAVDLQLERLRKKEIAFVMPGTDLLVFPISFVVVSTWAVIGIGAYVFGTLERIRFRRVYRERARVLERMGVRSG